MNDRRSASNENEPPPPDKIERDAARTGPLTEAALLGTTPSPRASLPEATAGSDATKALFGILVSYAVLIVGNGLLGSLIPIRMMHSAMSAIQIGFVQSSYYAGFIAGAFINGRLIQRIGQHRTFVAYSAAAALVAISFGTFYSPWIFAVIRLCSGCVFMGLYTAVESWLNGAVTNSNRGRIFGSYLTINYLAVGSGQFLLVTGDASGDKQLLLVAALFSAAVIPVTLMDGWPTKIKDSRLVGPQSMNVYHCFRLMASVTPLAVPGCIIAGFLYSSFYAMTPVYLTREGFTIEQLSNVMGYALIGALLPQWPIGKLSDRVDRRILIKWMAVCSAASAACLSVGHGPFIIRIALIFYAAATFTQYGLMVSHINDRTQPVHRVATSITLLIVFSFGGILGPAIAAVSMTILGPPGLFAFACLGSSVLALVAFRASKLQSHLV